MFEFKVLFNITDENNICENVILHVKVTLNIKVELKLNIKM